jgi:hypothetical protein
MKRTGIFIGLLMWAAAAKAATYYVSDCQSGAQSGCFSGKDTNDGLSPTDDGLGHGPWQTLEKALNSVSGAPKGTKFLFARGGVFSRSAAGIRLANFNSAWDNPIVIDAYTPSWASPSSNPPIINSAAGVYLFDFENGGNAAHDEGYVIRNLDLRGGGMGGVGIFMFNDVDYVTIESMRIDGFTIGVQLAGGNTPNPGSDRSNDNLILRNSTITNNSGMGFLGGGSDFLIENNIFDNNGFGDAVFDHNIYVSDNSGNSAIRNNTLTHSTMVNGMCQGVSLVVHGISPGLLIENNTIQEDVGGVNGYCYGIAVNPGGYGVPENFQGTIIRGNRVINVGNVGIGAASCPNCVIDNNVIVEEQPAIGFTGIFIPVQPGDADDAHENNAIIRNNSIYISSVVTNGKGIYMGKEGTGHVVVSNAIHYLGVGSGGWSCFDTTGLSTTSFAVFDNNLCDFPNASAGNGRWELSAGSLANWQAKGLDKHSLQADPQFISPGTPNLFLAVPSGSPAVNSGDLVYSSTMDITGQPRDASPDIGAYEFISGVGVPPAAPMNLSATAASSTTINLTWTAPAGPVTGYRIYRGIVLEGSSLTTSFSDTDLTPSTPYSYSVRAVDGGLLSDASNAASATTPLGAGPGPSGNNGAADPTPGLREAFAFPNPAKGVDPVIRAKLGLVDEVEITIFDAAGRAVHSATMDGASATVVNGDYCYDYAWTGNKASGIYYAVIHGKAGGKTIKARAAFAVVK